MQNKGKDSHAIFKRDVSRDMIKESNKIYQFVHQKRTNTNIYYCLWVSILKKNGRPF